MIRAYILLAVSIGEVSLFSLALYWWFTDGISGFSTSNIVWMLIIPIPVALLGVTVFLRERRQRASK